MWITESLLIENDRRGYQEVCSDCEAYGLKEHGLTRSDCTYLAVWSIYSMCNIYLRPLFNHRSILFKGSFDVFNSYTVFHVCTKPAETITISLRSPFEVSQ